MKFSTKKERQYFTKFLLYHQRRTTTNRSMSRWQSFSMPRFYSCASCGSCSTTWSQDHFEQCMLTLTGKLKLLILLLTIQHGDCHYKDRSDNRRDDDTGAVYCSFRFDCQAGNERQLERKMERLVLHAQHCRRKFNTWEVEM